MFRLKVLQINSVCGRQSTGKIVSDLQRCIISEGDLCAVAYGEKNSKPTKGDYHIGNEFTRYAHALQTRLRDRHGYGSVGATRKLIGFIKEYQPDIIHLHNLHGYYINLAVLFGFLKEYNRPVVWTMHDCWAITGHCAHFDYVGCSKWKNGCHNCKELKEYPASFFDGSARNYQLKKSLFTGLCNVSIVAPSVWLTELLKESYLSKFPAYTIHNGIRLDIFKPTESDIRRRYHINDNQKIILGVCSVWSYKKGFDDFIKLSELLPQNYTVVMIGLNKDQIKQLNGTRILALPPTDNTDELVKWYSAADFFVNPTYEDNFPTVNLEALACGTPVITYKTGGSAECLNEKCGRAVKQGDISEIAAVLINNTFDEKECISQSKNYDCEKCFSKYIDLYKNILNKQAW